MGLSAYEKQRLENIERNQRLLRELNVPLVGHHKSSSPTKTHAPKKRTKEPQPPARKSARIRGIAADTKSTLKDDTGVSQPKTPERIERLPDIDQQRGFETMLNSLNTFPNTKPEVDPSEPEKASSLTQRLPELQIRHPWTTVKVTPDRINCGVFHPDPTKILAIAADVSGHLGFWDTTASNKDSDDEEEQPVVYTYRPHTRTITDMKFAHDASKLYLSSYDGTIQMFDIQKSTFETLPMDAYPITTFDIAQEGKPHLYFATSDGELGCYDSSDPKVTMTQLREQKVGCIHINPVHPHLLAAASNDRSVSTWDLRHLKKPLQEFAHGYSATSAYWSPRGDKLVTTSYDDYIRLFSMQGSQVKLQQAIKHNNHTGRWVTNLRARWHPRETHHQYFTIGNMKHPVDVYSGETGQELGQLYDSERITAVPAVTQCHPTTDAVIIFSGNGSGRMICWT